MHSDNLHRFFQQVAFSIMVRNGNAHLKNFGVLYRSAAEVWLAPMFDVVTTSIYKYTQYQGGPELEDRTLEAIAAAMHQTLEEAKGDARMPAEFLVKMQAVWEEGMTYAR